MRRRRQGERRELERVDWNNFLKGVIGLRNARKITKKNKDQARERSADCFALEVKFFLLEERLDADFTRKTPVKNQRPFAMICGAHVFARTEAAALFTEPTTFCALG